MFTKWENHVQGKYSVTSDGTTRFNVTKTLTALTIFSWDMIAIWHQLIMITFFAEFFIVNGNRVINDHEPALIWKLSYNDQNFNDK